MTTPIRLECPLHFERQGRGARRVASPAASPVLPTAGRVPQVARLMALAIRIEELLRQGAVASPAEVARLGHVSRARVSQILNLTLLAPDLQEALLDLPTTKTGRDPLTLRDLQPIALTNNWKRQRRMWRELALKTITPKSARRSSSIEVNAGHYQTVVISTSLSGGPNRDCPSGTGSYNPANN